MLDSFFESISWPMEVPPAYGAFHILFTLRSFSFFRTDEADDQHGKRDQRNADDQEQQPIGISFDKVRGGRVRKGGHGERGENKRQG